MPKIEKYTTLNFLQDTDKLSGLDKNGSSYNFSMAALIDFAERKFPGQMGMYIPTKNYVYHSDKDFYVTYANPTSLEIAFRKERLFRLKSSPGAVGRSPESHPEYWVLQGSEEGGGTVDGLVISDIEGLQTALNTLTQKDVDLENQIVDNTPTIGVNGNWFIGATDTGVKAAGTDGNDGVGITGIALHATNGLVKTYRITFTNATTFDFDVTGGADETDATYASEVKVNVIDFKTDTNSDDEAIADCLKFCQNANYRKIVFSDKTWNISTAILLQSNTTVLIDNCKIKQNDLTFDNVFRGNNYTFENELLPTSVANDIPSSVTALQNVKILGIGAASIEGPDVNATGIHSVSGLSQTITGDFWGWRTYQVILSMCTGFELSGISFTQTRGWCNTFDNCSFGYIHDLNIISSAKNGDGIDLRNSCHDIVIENITGSTSDDILALSSIVKTGESAIWPNGNYQTTWEPSIIYAESKGLRDHDIYNININNVSALGNHNVLRLLAANGNMVHDININNVSDVGVASNKVNVLLMSGGYGIDTIGNPIYNINANNITSYNATTCVKTANYIMNNVWLNKISQLNTEKVLFELFSTIGILVTNSAENIVILPQLNSPVLSAGIPSETTIPLTITDTNNEPNESGVRIEYSDNGSTNWILEAVLSAGITNYVATAPSSTLRYFRASAVGDGVNNLTSDWSNIVSATTDDEPVVIVAPAVTTGVVNNMIATTATFNGNITSLGGESNTAHGFVYSLNANPTLADIVVDKGIATATGSFNSIISGLIDGNTYYVKAFATNSEGTSYGDEVSFLFESGSASAALVFDGINDFVSFTAIPITKSVIVKIDLSESAGVDFIIGGQGGGQNQGIYYYKDGNSLRVLGSNTPANNVIPYTYTGGIVVLLFNQQTNGTWKLYVNNVYIGTDSVICGDLTSMNTIGRRDGLSSYYFQGKIYGLALLSRSLTDNECLTFDIDNIALEPDLKVDFDFTTGLGTVLYDKSGNNNHGTISGAQWVEL